MGKNGAIKSLGKVIRNVAMHKLLLDHTNKSESLGHLKAEINEYTANAFEKSQEFNWNDLDLIEIREKAVNRVKNLSENYWDVNFSFNEIERVVNRLIEELGLR